jgi:putative DNA methylase
MTDDKRLIEDYLPIEAISAEASREKSVRKGHISTLHLWWARRPLVACRAALYGALVPASQFIPNGAQTDEKKKSLGRANAAKFMKRLCRYPSDTKPEEKADIQRTIKEAQHQILKAHAERLTREIDEWKRSKTEKPAWTDEFKFSGNSVTVDDITAGRAPRPRVLDMFAGGGAIPLEALRLGCEAYALDLNPVAHIIQLCTLVYPQKYGRPDLNARGMSGPKNARGETTWGGLAEEVRYWGEWVLHNVKTELADLYPLLPDPEFKGRRPQIQADWFKAHDEVPAGYLMPLAYLWTRTVQCKNPACKGAVPLVKQTWLCKRPGRYVAMKVVAARRDKRARFEVVEVKSEAALGFDPEAFSKAGNATCPICGTVADSEYVKDQGCVGKLSTQMMAAVCTRSGRKGKLYFSADDLPDFIPSDVDIAQRIAAVCKGSGLTLPTEKIVTDAKNCCWAILYGVATFKDLFLPRQLLCLLTFVSILRKAQSQVAVDERWVAIASSLGCWINRLADFESMMCTLKPGGERGVVHSFTRPAIPMVWDCAEANPFGTDSANAAGLFEYLLSAIKAAEVSTRAATVKRGSAASISLSSDTLDAVITDPPYYDNVPYADVSDFFYVWLKRSIGTFHSEHFASEGTPKKAEAVSDATRHGNSKETAKKAYEEMMGQSFSEAHRLLKSSGELVVVYAHKTTLGWTTLVDALRNARFTVSEAWPLDTEMKSRLRGLDSAALASSIFLVARKREEASEVGNYEEHVRGELDEIVRERVDTLWEMSVSGADLVIACVGAGLRAFTRFGRVEYANGEEVPADRFLTEVETVVLDTILRKLSKAIGGNGSRSRSLAGLDPATRFYVLWRYTYGVAELDAGEAIIFANGTHVELDGPLGLSTGSRALVEKKKGKYKLRDFAERGDDDDLGLPDEETGEARPAIDVLHRLLWLLEKRPPLIADFIADSNPSIDQLRLVAQALAGPALKGGELENVSPTAEQSALGKLLANWSSIVEGKVVIQDRRSGQQQLKL